MKKYILFALLAFCSSAFAVKKQPIPTPVTPPAWDLVGVKNEKGDVVGYIYHSYAIGTLDHLKDNVKSEKNIVGLRLVCSRVGKSEPLLVFYWNGGDETKHESAVIISVDRTFNPEVTSYIWTHEHSIIYRSLSESGALIDQMK